MSAQLRVPPHNLHAEESLLGAMLLSRDAIGTGLEFTSADDFYKPAHSHVFTAIADLYARAEPADPVTVADELNRAGLMEAVGGPAALIDLQSGTPAIGNAARYATIVAEHALLRRMIGAAAEIADNAYSLPDDVAAAADDAERIIFNVVERRGSADNLVTLREMTEGGLERLQALFEDGRTITGLPTGYRDLDDRLCGLQKSALYVVGARPGVGKTSFALGMAVHAAVVSKEPVLFFSLEMGRDEMFDRIVSQEAKIEASKLRNGTLLDQDWGRLSNCINGIVDAPLVINDSSASTIMEIRSQARRMKARGGLSLVVLDYVQLMETRRGAENRQLAISEISRGLKVLARELEVPVVALSQLSRGLEQRADKRPMLSDLRESGSLEQDSDVVMFLYRDEMYNPESPDRGLAEVIVAKHRSGPTGTERLAFLERYTRFANMARI